MVFSCDTYYPSGGLNDCFDSFDTIPEAVEAVKNNRGDYYEIFDRIDGVEIVISE